MAKNVFRPADIMYISRKVFIEPPRIVAEEPEETTAEVMPETSGPYAGPTVEDLRKEADTFRRGWEGEKAKLLAEAQAEAEKIRKDAEQVAFDEVKRKNNQAQKIRQEAEDQAQAILAEAKQKASALEDDIKQRVTQT